MDFLSDDLPEDVEDSKWLSEETNALASKIGTALSSSVQADAVAASSSGQMTDSTSATSGLPDALLPKFGAHVRVRFKGHEHAFVLGRTNPMTLPIPLFDVIKTMSVGDRKRLDSVSEAPKHPSLVLAKDEAQTVSDVPTTSDASGPQWEPSDEVELLEVEKVEHVVSSGSIVKRVIECPEETRNDRHTPVFETVVTLDLLGRLEDTNEIFDKRDNVAFRIGEGELGMGMEKAVRTMHRGEKSQFTFMPPWPVSLCEAPLIAMTPTELKNSVVVYDVYLKSFVDAKNPFECKTYEDHLEEALLRKESGNQAHEAKKYTLAITKYTKAQFFLEQFGNDFETEEQRKTYDQLKASLALNLAASNLKLEQYEKVKLHCTNALEIDPKNVKGLYRRASALVALKDFNGAHKDLQELLKLEPENALAKHLMKRVEAKFAQDSIEERKVYQQMFAPRDEPKEESTGKGVQTTSKDSQDSKWTLYVLIASIVLVLAYATNMFMSTNSL